MNSEQHEYERNLTEKDKVLLKKLFKRGGVSLVVDNGGETLVTAFFNTDRFRESKLYCH